MASAFDSFATGALVVAAVAVAVALLHREFGGSAPRNPLQDSERPPEYVKEWDEMLRVAVPVYSPGAKVKLVEFADLECPACRLFYQQTKGLRRRFGADFGVYLVHFPLPQHRFAKPAARAAECAERFGRFGALHDLLYEKQDSLGLKSWASFAAAAGVKDTVQFARCAADTAAVPRIAAGLALGKKVGVRGTPTIVLNGWRYWSIPDSTELEHVITEFLEGKAPFGTQPARRHKEWP